jgi:predicted RecB family nuclease
MEQPISWTDPETNLACKARPDWIIPDRRILIDLKTCLSADARRFGASAARYGYHLQMAMYANALTHGLGWAPNKCKIIAVEKDGPHEISVFDVPQDALDMAAEEVATLLRMVQTCRQTNNWPSRYVSEQALQLPAYIYGETEFEYE